MCVCTCVRLPGGAPSPCASATLLTERQLCAVVWDVCWAPSASGTASKNGEATHQPAGVTECTGGGGGSAFLLSHSFPAALVPSPRKVFELHFPLSFCLPPLLLFSPSVSFCRVNFFPASHTHTRPSAASVCLDVSTSPCFHRDLCVCSRPWHRSAAASLTGFVSKELSAGGRWKALS